jgi:hypothetical protein
MVIMTESVSITKKVVCRGDFTLIEELRCYREGKSSKFFNGKENERIPGTRTEELFDTDEKKDTFFKKYGYLRSMFDDHPEVMDYSHEYYENRKKEK